MKHWLPLSLLLLLISACQMQEVLEETTMRYDEFVDIEQLDGIQHDCRVRYPLPPETIDRWASDLIDEDGNILQYAYTKEETQEYKGYCIAMNWGNQDGIYDYTYYSPNSPWAMGDVVFDLNHKIIVKK